MFLFVNCGCCLLQCVFLSLLVDVCCCVLRAVAVGVACCCFGVAVVRCFMFVGAVVLVAGVRRLPLLLLGVVIGWCCCPCVFCVCCILVFVV